MMSDLPPIPAHLYRFESEGGASSSEHQTPGEFTLDGIGSCSSLQLSQQQWGKLQQGGLFPPSLSRGSTMDTLGAMSFPSLSRPASNSVDALLQNVAAETMSIPQQLNPPSLFSRTSVASVLSDFQQGPPLETKMSAGRRKKLEAAAKNQNIQNASESKKESPKKLSPKKTAMKAPSKTPIKSKASVAKKPAPSKRPPRNKMPEVMRYKVPSEKDVLCQRGGLSGKHPGNKKYLSIILERQDEYKAVHKNDKATKTTLAQKVVDIINNDIGGQFLALEKETNRWYIVDNSVARTKASQALRDDHSSEGRKQKRERFPAKPKKSKKTQKTNQKKSSGAPILPKNVEQV